MQSIDILMGQMHNPVGWLNLTGIEIAVNQFSINLFTEEEKKNTFFTFEVVLFLAGRETSPMIVLSGDWLTDWLIHRRYVN